MKVFSAFYNSKLRLWKVESYGLFFFNPPHIFLIEFEGKVLDIHQNDDVYDLARIIILILLEAPCAMVDPHCYPLHVSVELVHLHDCADVLLDSYYGKKPRYL